MLGAAAALSAHLGGARIPEEPAPGSYASGPDVQVEGLLCVGQCVGPTAGQARRMSGT